MGMSAEGKVFTHFPLRRKFMRKPWGSFSRILDPLLSVDVDIHCMGNGDAIAYCLGLA